MKHKKTSEIRQNLRNKWIEDLQTSLSVLCGIVVAFPVSETTPYVRGVNILWPLITYQVITQWSWDLIMFINTKPEKNKLLSP